MIRKDPVPAKVKHRILPSTESTMEMNRKMARITLLERSLNQKIEEYEAEELNEAYVERKIYIKRLEEVEGVQE